MEQKYPVRKISIICSKGTLEDVYSALIMGNGAVMEGIDVHLFFTFFGMDAITKSRMDRLHATVVGNPSLRLPGGITIPTLLGVIPGMESLASSMMKRRMAKLDIPPVSEFFDLITAGGGKIYACRTAADMFRIKKEDLCEHVTAIITVGEFYDLAAGEGSQIIFI
jgi:peroxiredoxin family protein